MFAAGQKPFRQNMKFSTLLASSVKISVVMAFDGCNTASPFTPVLTLSPDAICSDRARALPPQFNVLARQRMLLVPRVRDARIELRTVAAFTFHVISYMSQANESSWLPQIRCRIESRGENTWSRVGRGWYLLG
jgi:hypothetical protein